MADFYEKYQNENLDLIDVREVIHEFKQDMHRCQKSSVKYLGARLKNSKLFP